MGAQKALSDTQMDISKGVPIRDKFIPISGKVSKVKNKPKHKTSGPSPLV